MATDIKSLRTRMKSVDSTLHLTKAMGLVASSKIRRANIAMQKSKEYSLALEQILDLITSSDECAKSPFIRGNSTGKTKLIVIAGDRGLAGGYNANVFREAKKHSDADIIAIGKRSYERYKGEYFSSEHFSYTDSGKLAKKLCAEYLNNQFDKLGIIYTKYISMMTQNAVVEWILPLKRGTKSNSSVLFEPDEAAILNTAVAEYLTGKINFAVRESFACEVAARRMAMDSAGKNASEMLDNLQLEYNRARQGAITQEITEIVAGSGGE